MQNVHVNFKPGSPWQKQHLTRRRLISPGDWTQIYRRN